jgi:hypothetical protein
MKNIKVGSSVHLGGSYYAIYLQSFENAIEGKVL